MVPCGAAPDCRGVFRFLSSSYLQFTDVIHLCWLPSPHSGVCLCLLHAQARLPFICVIDALFLLQSPLFAFLGFHFVILTYVYVCCQSTTRLTVFSCHSSTVTRLTSQSCITCYAPFCSAWLIFHSHLSMINLNLPPTWWWGYLFPEEVQVIASTCLPRRIGSWLKGLMVRRPCLSPLMAAIETNFPIF